MGNPVVANTAARMLSEVTVNKATAAELMVNHYLHLAIPSDEDRVAEAFRLTNPRHAVDLLKNIEGEKRKKARAMIKKIGGEYAFSALEPLQKFQPHKNKGDIAAYFLTIISLIFTIIFGAFGAGLTLNLLLKKAVEFAGKVFERIPDQ